MYFDDLTESDSYFISGDKPEPGLPILSGSDGESRRSGAGRLEFSEPTDPGARSQVVQAGRQRVGPVPGGFANLGQLSDLRRQLLQPALRQRVPAPAQDGSGRTPLHRKQLLRRQLGRQGAERAVRHGRRGRRPAGADQQGQDAEPSDGTGGGAGGFVPRDQWLDPRVWREEGRNQ